MSTTRHLVNRRRRLAAQPRPAPRGPAADRAGEEIQDVQGAREAEVQDAVPPRRAARPRPAGARPRARTGGKRIAASGAPPRDSAEGPAGSTARRLPAPLARLLRGTGAGHRLLLCCAVLTLVLGGFAGWAAAEAGALRDASSARNTALADAGRTSEVKGEVTSAVNALFSYDHAAPGRTERAAKRLLTGRAVAQHRELLAPVRRQSGEQRIVLTTTVTDSAVTALEGDRARVLLFADQHSARTAGGKAGAKGAERKKGKKGKAEKDDGATYAGAMLAVNAVHQDGRWKIAAIDTLS